MKNWKRQRLFRIPFLTDLSVYSKIILQYITIISQCICLSQLFDNLCAIYKTTLIFVMTDEKFHQTSRNNDLTYIELSTIDFSIHFSWKKADKNIIYKLTFLRYLLEYNTFSTPNWLRSSSSSDVHWLTRWQIKKSLYQIPFIS